jgi:hypothetical protein
MQRTNKRYVLDLLNAPPSTEAWVAAMMDEITESIEDVPECEAVLTVTALEVSDENQE